MHCDPACELLNLLQHHYCGQSTSPQLVSAWLMPRQHLYSLTTSTWLKHPHICLLYCFLYNSHTHTHTHTPLQLDLMAFPPLGTSLLNKLPLLDHCWQGSITQPGCSRISLPPPPQLLSIWSVLPPLSRSPMTSTRLTHSYSRIRLMPFLRLQWHQHWLCQPISFFTCILLHCHSQTSPTWWYQTQAFRTSNSCYNVGTSCKLVCLIHARPFSAILILK